MNDQTSPVASGRTSPDAEQPHGHEGAPKLIREKNKAYGKTAKKGAVWSIVRQSGHELIAIPAAMIMARLLTPTDFGIAAAASFFMVLASRLTQFGFNAAMVRIKELRPEHASSVFVVNLAMGVLTWIVLFSLAPFLGQLFRSASAASVLRFASFTFLITPFGTVPSAMVYRSMHFRHLALADWTDLVLGTVVSVACAKLGFGFWSITYGNMSGIVVRILLLYYLSGWKPSLRFSRPALKELLSFGLGVQTKRLFEYATLNLDNLIVGRMLGMSQLGIYDKAFATMSRFVQRLTLGQAPFRIFSIIHEDAERFRRAYSRLILSITLLGFPALAGCIVAAKSLFVVLYGEQWLAAVLPFQVLCVGGMLKLLDAYASQANEAAGNIWAQAYRQSVGAVLVVIGAMAGSYYGGVTGAAGGVLCAMIVLTCSMQTLVRRATGLSWRGMLEPQLPAWFTTAVVVVVLLATEALVRILAPTAAAWQLLLAQVVGGGLFYGALVIFSPFAIVREIVSESANDLLPDPALRIFHRLSRLTPTSSAP